MVEPCWGAFDRVSRDWLPGSRGKYAGLRHAKFISLSANLIGLRAPAYTPGYALIVPLESKSTLNCSF